MSSQTKIRYTPQEYLAIERGAEERSEYFDGEIFAMGGASEQHNLIGGNIFASLHFQLKTRPCKVYSSDMRVKVNETGLYTYPDVVALCAPSQFDDHQKDTLINPALIIEVLSKSTEGYDRGEKFAHYRKIETLMEYVLIAQNKHHIERYVRQQDNNWLMSETYNVQDTIKLVSIDCSLALAEIYDKVEFNIT